MASSWQRKEAEGTLQKQLPSPTTPMTVLLANTPNQAETLLHSLERAATSIGLHVYAHKTEYMCYNQTGDISTLDGTSLKLVDKFTYLGSSVSSTKKDIDTWLLHSLEWAAAGIGLHVNGHKTEYMCYNQTGDISTLDETSLKLVDKFTYLGSSLSSTEKDIDTWLTKAWTAIDRLSIIWKSDLTDKMKHSFFQAAVIWILLYGCTTWTLTKRLKKKLDGNYTRMLRVVLNKSWRQHPTRHQLYGHLPPITKTMQARQTRHAGHCWRSKDELISDVLLWTPAYGQAKAGRPARTYIQQLCEDMGCSPEDLPEAMNDGEKWRERVRDIHANGTTWWWWWWTIS